MAKWYLVIMKARETMRKMTNKEGVAREIFEVYGAGLSGDALQEVAITAWIKNMKIAYPRYCFCIHNDEDCDRVMFIIEEYKQIVRVSYESDSSD